MNNHSELVREKLLSERVDALEKLLACYRTGQRPTEKLLNELDRTKRAIDATLKNLGAE